jgi:hypothetical protein
MAYDLPFLDHHAQHRLNRQIASLAREANQISDVLGQFTRGARRDAAHYAHDAGHYAHDLTDEAWRQGAVAAKVLGKQALRAGKAVGRDPMPAVVAVAGLACVLSLVLASGRRANRRRPM